MRERRDSSPARRVKARSTLLQPTIVTVFLSEAAERCCYYGLVSMLPLFLVEGPARTAPHIAAATIAAFSAAAYATPLLGSALAATRLRMFGTIMSLSVVYLVGMSILPLSASIRVPEEGEPGYAGAVFVARLAVFSGLSLIALGTGGIKPNVAAFGALQVPNDAARDGAGDCGEEVALDASQSVSGGDVSNAEPSAHEASLASFFSAFYFLINCGSIVGQGVLPAVQKRSGYGAAFAAAACVLLVAIIAFTCGEYCTWTGYTHETPCDTAVVSDIANHLDEELGDCDGAQGAFPPPSTLTLPLLLSVALASRLGNDWPRAERLFGVPTCVLLRTPVTTLGNFAIISLYWVGYSANAGLWLLQVNQTRLPWGLSAAQWTAINPITVLIALPIGERCTRGVPITTRIMIGFGMASLAIMLSVCVQLAVDLSSAATTPHTISAFWTLPHWILLSFSEVLSSVTGLELAYSGAGTYAPQLKSALQACWLLCASAGAAGAALTIALLGSAGLGPMGLLFVLGSMDVVGTVLFWRRTKTMDAASARNGSLSGSSRGEAIPLVPMEEEI